MNAASQLPPKKSRLRRPSTQGLAGEGVRHKQRLATIKMLDRMLVYSTERIALFIDGANFFASAKALNLDVDFKKLIDLFRSQGRLVRALYYTPVSNDDEFSSVRPLIDWLGYNGYSVVTKPGRSYLDSAGHRTMKGNMKVDLAVDALQLAQELDHIVLFSGDGDFRCLVADLQARGCRVSVVSTLKSQPPMVSDELRRQADQFIELLDVAPDISRDTVVRPKRATRVSRAKSS